MPPAHPHDRYVTADAVKDAVAILDVAEGYGLQFRRAGREFVCLSPLKPERTPSFFVDPHKGLFKCFASGEGGDVIRFVQLMDNCSFQQALTRLATGAGLGDPEEQRRRAEAYRRRARDQETARLAGETRKIGLAWHLWRQTVPAYLTAAEAYLRWRGIDCDALRRVYGWHVPARLRFHAGLSSFDDAGQQRLFPAMVGAAYAEIRGGWHFRGIHRTLLADDGQGKAAVGSAKRMLGKMLCAESRLSDPAPVAVIGEGYETVLSVMSVLARDGEAVFGVSALSLGNLAGAGLKRPGDPPKFISPVPDPARPGLMLPDSVREVIILKDADGKKPEEIDIFIRRAATKFQRAGKRVRVASPELGKDFNDMLMTAAPAECAA